MEYAKRFQERILRNPRDSNFFTGQESNVKVQKEEVVYLISERGVCGWEQICRKNDRVKEVRMQHRIQRLAEIFV